MAQVELWFDFASTYSYVAAMRAEDAAGAAGVPLAWRPFLLGPIFTAQLGIKDSPFNVFPVRGRYMWRDLERLCARYRLPWRRPSAFPRASVAAARLASAALDAPWAPELIRRLFVANFGEDRDIGDPAVLGDVVRSLGRDPAPLLARASSQEVKDLVRRRTTAAADLGLFGAPTFVVAGELFFGQDRLDEALAWAAAGPGETSR